MYKVVKKIATIGCDDKNPKEVRLVIWGLNHNRTDVSVDVRRWSSFHGDRPLKGLTMKFEEAKRLRDVLNEMEELKD